MAAKAKVSVKTITRSLPPKKSIKGGLVRTGWTNNHNLTLLPISNVK